MENKDNTWPQPSSAQPTSSTLLNNPTFTEKDSVIYNKVIDSMAPYRVEISKRNQYVQRRDDYIYGNGLSESLTFPPGFDQTIYNWLERAVDIHVSQLMGRPFGIYSRYTKKDISTQEDQSDPNMLQGDIQDNKRLKANAAARDELANAIIRDNGGFELFQTGAYSGSSYGFTVYKSWLNDGEDKERRPWCIEMVENIQNYYALWSSDNFRRKRGDIYNWQISPTDAYQDYGQYLQDGEKFIEEPLGIPMTTIAPAPATPEEGYQPMVRVIEYTGILDGICSEQDGSGDLYACEPGDENEVNILIVGGKVVRVEDRPDYLPRYYNIPNIRLMRRPWGRADITDTCIEINRTVLQRVSDWITLQDKTLFSKYMGLGMDASTVPRPQPRTIEVFPMDADQKVELIQTPQVFENAYPNIIKFLEDNFIRSARISRVLFDDPELSASSNAALLTTMKGVIDAVEKKQKIWTPILVDMFEDAIRTLANHHDDVKNSCGLEDNWWFYIKWPSILRKDDPTYRTMILNTFNAGGMSADTLLEELGYEDPSQEMDRMRDNLQDGVPAAIMGHQLPMLAQRANMPPYDPSLRIPQIKHTVTWHADFTPQQQANLASELGWQDGPFGASMGPQGREGIRAEDNAANQGFLTGPASLGGLPVLRGPNGEILPTPTPPKAAAKKGKGAKGKGKAAPAPAPAAQPGPQATPEMNQPGTGPVSMPGSGAPTPMSPEGALANQNQNRGV